MTMKHISVSILKPSIFNVLVIVTIIERVINYRLVTPALRHKMNKILEIFRTVSHFKQISNII